jgi:ribosomal protein L14E/L6E/L27E
MFSLGKDLVGLFAVSKSGHDAGEVYVIVSAAGNFVNVANGKNRTIQKPKKKNRGHLAITRQSVPDIQLLIKGEPVSSNLKLAGAIKKYLREQKDPSPRVAQGDKVKEG